MILRWLEIKTSHLNLYAFRFFYSIFLFYHAADRTLYYWETADTGPFRGLAFLIPFQGTEVSFFQIHAFLGFMALSFGLFALGIIPKVSGICAWLSYLSVFWPMNYEFKPYDDNLVFFNLLILTVAPIGSFSQFQWKKVLDERVPAWPLELIKVNLSLVYFSAFVSKIVNGGWEWGNGVTLQNYLYERHLMTGNSLALWVANHWWICLLLSVFTLFAEATFWTVLIRNRMTPFVILAGLGMHIGIYFLMSINFIVFTLSYLVFVPYDRIARKASNLSLLANNKHI